MNDNENLDQQLSLDQIKTLQNTNNPIYLTENYPKEIKTIGPLLHYQEHFNLQTHEVEYEKDSLGRLHVKYDHDENGNLIIKDEAKWDDQIQYDILRGVQVYDDYLRNNETKTPIDAETMIDDPALNKLADIILKEAIQDKAEDIFIVQYKYFGIVRHFKGETFNNYRILYRSAVDPLITILKKRAGLVYDLKEARRAQTNGQIVFNNINFRVAADSNQYGMFIDLRQQATRFESLDDLNLPDNIKVAFRHAIAAKDGLTIVGGPVGSGKTTLMTTGLIEYQKKAHANILSLEQPIELPIDGIVQKDIDEHYGVTWENALDAALRERPQIIRVGETSTRKSAQAIVRAANTGINAMTTLHIKSAIEVFETLKSLGVEENDIKNSLRLVIYMNRVPMLCPYCSQTKEFERTIIDKPDVREWVKRHLSDNRSGEIVSVCERNKEGCSYCRANQTNPDLYGTLGKISVYEYLKINRPMLRIYRRYKDEDAYVLKDKLLHPETITWGDKNDPDKKDIDDNLAQVNDRIKAQKLASGLEYYSLERDVLTKLKEHKIDFDTARYIIDE